MKLNNLKKYDWLVHCLILILIATFSIYFLVSVVFRDFNPINWGKAAKILAFLLMALFNLPIVAIIIHILTKKTKK